MLYVYDIELVEIGVWWWTMSVWVYFFPPPHQTKVQGNKNGKKKQKQKKKYWHGVGALRYIGLYVHEQKMCEKGLFFFFCSTHIAGNMFKMTFFQEKEGSYCQNLQKFRESNLRQIPQNPCLGVIFVSWLKCVAHTSISECPPPPNIDNHIDNIIFLVPPYSATNRAWRRRVGSKEHDTSNAS